MTQKLYLYHFINQIINLRFIVNIVLSAIGIKYLIEFEDLRGSIVFIIDPKQPNSMFLSAQHRVRRGILKFETIFFFLSCIVHSTTIIPRDETRRKSNFFSLSSIFIFIICYFSCCTFHYNFYLKYIVNKSLFNLKLLFFNDTQLTAKTSISS